MDIPVIVPATAADFDELINQQLLPISELSASPRLAGCSAPGSSNSVMPYSSGCTMYNEEAGARRTRKWLACSTRRARGTTWLQP